MRGGGKQANTKLGSKSIILHAQQKGIFALNFSSVTIVRLQGPILSYPRVHLSEPERFKIGESEACKTIRSEGATRVPHI